MFGRRSDGFLAVAKAIALSLIITLIPTTPAAATPEASVSQITATSSINYSTNPPSSGFDVSWQFSTSDTIPVSIGLLTCRMDFSLNFDQSSPRYLSPQDWDAPYAFRATSYSSIATQGLSSSSVRVDIPESELGLYFFRVIPASFLAAQGESDPLDSAYNFCVEERPELATSQFRLTTTELKIVSDTNPFTTANVFSSDARNPQNQIESEFFAAQTNSAPLAVFKMDQDHENFLFHSGRLKTLVNQVPEAGSSPNPCGRSLAFNTWENTSGVPGSQGEIDESPEFDWSFYPGSVYIKLCSWENFPIQPSEAANPNFQGRSVSNQVWVDAPVWFPHATHGYGLSTNSSVANPALVQAQPITTELNMDFRRGNAISTQMSFIAESTTSAEIVLQLPTDQAAFDSIQSFFIHYSSIDGSDAGFLNLSPGSYASTFSHLLDDLNTTTYSATLFVKTNWGLARSATTTIDLSKVRFTASFNVNGYDRYHPAPAPRGTYNGNSIVLPTFSYLTATFSGWALGDVLYQPGEAFTLSDDVTFIASFSAETDASLRGLTLSSDQPSQFQFFPAFDPAETDYYLNIGNQDFSAINVSALAPLRGEVSRIYTQVDWCDMGQSLNSSGSTFSAVFDSSDLHNACSPNPPPRDLVPLYIQVKSEYDLENNLEASKVYTIYIARGLYSAGSVSLTFEDFNSDTQGDVPAFSNGPQRYIQFPGPGSLSRPGYDFAGWQPFEGGATYLPGDIILLQGSLGVEPIWELDEPSIYGFDFDYLSLDTYDTVSYEVLEAPMGLSQIDYFIMSQGPYRLTLYDNAGQPVSWYSDHPSYSSDIQNATSTSIQAPLACAGPDMSNCPATFSLELEYWDLALEESRSRSYQIAIATNSDEVCSYIYPFPEVADYGALDPCEDGADWLGYPGIGFYEMMADSEEISGAIEVWEDGEIYYRTGEDVYALIGYSLDPNDDGSGLWQPGERRPIFGETELYSIWKRDLMPEISNVTIFGKDYEVRDCNIGDEDDPYTSSCLISELHAVMQPYVSNDGGLRFYLSQTFSSQVDPTTLTISFSHSAALDTGLFGMGADLLDNCEGYEQVEGSIFSTTFDENELCDGGSFPAKLFIGVYAESTYGYFTREFGFDVVLAEPDAELGYSFDPAGGTGVSTISGSVVGQWITTPSLENARRQGYRPWGWSIAWAGETLEYIDGGPLPILFDNQVMSVVWNTAYRVEFFDGFTDSPISFRYVDWNDGNTAPAWSDNWYVPEDLTHPQGYELLGWTVISGSDQAITFDGLTVNEDLNFYPVWDLPEPTQSQQVEAPSSSPNPAPTPVTQNPQPVLTPPATVSPTPSTSSPVATSSNSVSPTTSTSIGVVRVNGMTAVSVGLPAKYIGRIATIEVKRWINNRVRYFVLDSSRVQAPTAAQGGNATLKFDFKLTLRPTDTIRIKVGKVEVLKKKVGR